MIWFEINSFSWITSSYSFYTCKYYSFLTPMGLRYTVCGVCFPILENFHIPGFLQLFQHKLMLGLSYPGKFPYSIKTSILKSAYLFERNKNCNKKLLGIKRPWYVLFHFMTWSQLFNLHNIMFKYIFVHRLTWNILIHISG